MDGMTIEMPSDAKREEAPRTGQMLPRATIEFIVKNRDLALSMHSEAYDLLHVGKQAVAAAHAQARKAMLGKTRYNDHVSSGERDKHAHAATLAAKDVYMADIQKVLDTDVWSSIVKTTDLERLMDKKAKDQLKQELLTNPPEVTAENIRATLEQFILDADTIFKRGIAECFSALERRFKSHDGWKIGSRIILANAFSAWGSWNSNRNHDDSLRDIERVFLTLDGVPPTASYGGIVDSVSNARSYANQTGTKQSLFENEYFRIRSFMNGNCHIWFLRDDLVERVNQLLGEYYNAPIPEDREAEEHTGLHDPKTSLAKNYGFFPTPDTTAEKALHGVYFYKQRTEEPMTVLEPSAGTGNLARRCIWTKKELRQHVSERYEGEYRTDTRVDCVEVQTALADRLNAEGIYRKVYNLDFLALQPSTTGLYDKVVMNPPFDRERDIDHVMHALKFVKPDGELVAIMSASTEFRDTKKSVAFRALIKKMKGHFSDLPAGSFSSVGTNCNTLVLRVRKDGNHPRW